jgi:hypothetical protein
MNRPFKPFRQTQCVNLLAKLLESLRSPKTLQKDAVCPKTLAPNGRTWGQKEGLALIRKHDSAQGLRASPKTDAQVRRLSPLSRKSFLMCALMATVVVSVFWVGDAFAHDGELFREEIGKVEKLFTGGYMRIGLLGVCGLTAVMGAAKQNAWMFLSGILAGVFAFFMRDWVLTTFACVI